MVSQTHTHVDLKIGRWRSDCGSNCFPKNRHNMKILNIKLLAVAMITLWTSVGAFAQIKQVDIQATGLTCSMCSNAINKQLLSLPEVAEVTTDLNTNTF